TTQETKIETKEPSKPKTPKEEKIDELNKKIEEERRKRITLIDGIKRMRYKTAYKQAELAALSKLTSINTDKTKNIGYLKRLKEKLEFKISTEASSLSS